MILTCPSCATRYFVKDGAVPPEGRTVRCAACATEWRAEAETPSPTAKSPGAPGAPDADAPLPTAYRAKVAAQRQTREALAAGVVWASLSAVFVALAFAAVLFRVEVVRAFPRANAAYAAVRMPVNPTGLALEGVQGGPGLENGRQVLVVTGALRNVEAGARRPRALRVSVYDKAGRRTTAQRVIPAGGEIAPGEARTFRAVFYDPPLSAAEFGVDFAWDAPAAPAPHTPFKPAPARPAPRPAPHAGALHPAAEPAGDIAGPVVASHGPVADAAPLPADSPYALHAPAAHLAEAAVPATLRRAAAH